MKRNILKAHLHYRDNKKPLIRHNHNININEYTESSIVSGEKFQNLANVFLGIPEDFKINPFFYNCKQEKLNIKNIKENYENPSIIFCFTNRINILSEKIKYFQNPFVLITHNSDDDINDINMISNILTNEKLKKWFCQNLCIHDIHDNYYNKLHFLPIGIANIQWKHGRDFYNFKNHSNHSNHSNEKTKTKEVYMCFTIGTNSSKRGVCYNKLSKKVPFLSTIDSLKNIERMQEYKFCICPDGNGIDTHRFWEALYLKIVPIVLRNPLNSILEKYTNIPMVILDSWDDFSYSKLPDYEKIDFSTSSKYLDMSFYKDIILDNTL
jgi:hypothetical protein